MGFSQLPEMLSGPKRERASGSLVLPGLGVLRRLPGVLSPAEVLFSLRERRSAARGWAPTDSPSRQLISTSVARNGSWEVAGGVDRTGSVSPEAETVPGYVTFIKSPARQFLLWKPGCSAGEG